MSLTLLGEIRQQKGREVGKINPLDYVDYFAPFVRVFFTKEGQLDATHYF